MLVPVVAGSDKTTVSVATGHQAYHPVYASVGNISNTVRRAHGNGVVPFAFLPIPKCLSVCLMALKEVPVANIVSLQKRANLSGRSQPSKNFAGNYITNVWSLHLHP
jgi:hypothetical protein